MTFQVGTGYTSPEILKPCLYLQGEYFGSRKTAIVRMIYDSVDNIRAHDPTVQSVQDLALSER